MGTNSKHTPDFIEVIGISENYGAIYAKKPDGSLGANVATAHGQDLETVKANGERLAHCWNCHDEMLEALEQAEKWVDAQIISSNHISDHDRKVYNLIVMAIVKAKGKKHFFVK